MSPSGKFITFEGGEGTGKSTQAKMLSDRLIARGIDVVLTREPGGSPCGELIRKLILETGGATSDPLAEFLLFSAARAEHLAVTIRPALRRGAWVICDRFLDSSRAYQGAMWGVAPQAIADIERHVVGRDYPALTFLLDLSPELALQRIGQRGQSNRIDAEDLGFHAKLRGAFLTIAGAEPTRFRVVNADAPPENVADAIWSSVQQAMMAQEPAKSDRP